MITATLFISLYVIARLMKIRRQNVVIFLFIVLFPLKSIVPPSEMLFGIISPDNIIALFAVIYLPFKDPNVLRQKMDRPKRNAIIFFIVINLGLFYYIVLKNLIILPAPAIPTIKTIVNDAIFLFLLIYLVKSLDKKSVYLAIEKGIVVSSIILGLSIFFAERLFSLGLNPDIGMFNEWENVTSRPSGFYFNDPNVTGMFCLIYYFFILSKILFNEKRNPLYFIALICLFLGIINTGSRSSFLALFFTMGLTLFGFRKKIKCASFFLILVALIVALFFIYSEFGTPMNERLSQVRNSPRLGTSFADRVLYWEIYLGQIMDNPEFLIIGNLDPPRINRAIHNFYIMMLYYGGAGVIFLYFALLRRIQKHRIQSSNPEAFPVIYPLLACSIVLFTLSDFPPNSLALVFALSSGLTVFKQPTQSQALPKQIRGGFLA